MNKNFFTVLLLFSVVFIYSCQSVPSKISQEWTDEKFFVAAQEASDMEEYNKALYYYDVYMVRYPENFRKVMAARYEKAFIYYKKKKYDQSKEMFLLILDDYETSPYSMFFEERYRILTHKVLKKIEEKKNPIKNKLKKNKNNKEEEATPEKLDE